MKGQLNYNYSENLTEECPSYYDVNYMTSVYDSDGRKRIKTKTFDDVTVVYDYIEERKQENNIKDYNDFRHFLRGCGLSEVSFKMILERYRKVTGTGIKSILITRKGRTNNA